MRRRRVIKKNNSVEQAIINPEFSNSFPGGRAHASYMDFWVVGNRISRDVSTRPANLQASRWVP